MIWLEACNQPVFGCVLRLPHFWINISLIYKLFSKSISCFLGNWSVAIIWWSVKLVWIILHFNSEKQKNYTSVINLSQTISFGSKFNIKLGHVEARMLHNITAYRLFIYLKHYFCLSLRNAASDMVHPLNCLADHSMTSNSIRQTKNIKDTLPAHDSAITTSIFYRHINQYKSTFCHQFRESKMIRIETVACRIVNL